MLAKCANPACSARFCYFHEGKLLALDRQFIRRQRDRLLIRITRVDLNASDISGCALNAVVP